MFPVVIYSSIFKAIALPTDGISVKPFNFHLLYIFSTFEDKFSMTSAVRLYALILKTVFTLFLFLLLSSLLSCAPSSNSIRYAIWRKTLEIAALLIMLS